MDAVFEIKNRPNGDFYWILKAENGQAIATSYNDYKNEVAIKNAIQSVKKYSSHPSTKIKKHKD